MMGRIFLTLFVSTMASRINLFTMDCAGGFSGGMSPRTDFLDMGMDMGMLKRGIDEVVQIVHEHVRCACPLITDDEIASSFTPNVKAVLNALHGADVTPLTDLCQFENIQQVDSLLQDLMAELGVSHQDLPATCSLTEWQKKDHCAFKVPLGDDVPSYLQDTSFLFGIKQCPNSVWPYVSVSVEGSFLDNIFNPCEKDSDCGNLLTCGRIKNSRETYECFNSQPNAPVSCIDDRLFCEEGFSKKWVDDGVEQIPQCVKDEVTNVELEKEIIPSLLHLSNIFPADSECDEYDFCNVGKKVQNEFMTYMLEKMGKDKKYTAKEAKFCGVSEIMEETDGTRHQDTMKRALSTISKVSNIPMHLLSWIRDTVQLDSGDIFMPTSLRRLLQEDPLQEDEENKDEQNDIINILENTTLESWTNVDDTDTFAPATVSGSGAKFLEEKGSETNRVSLMRKTCQHQYNFFGGHQSGGMRSYFMKFPTLASFGTTLVKKLVECGNPDLTLEQLRSRFLPFDPSFWLKMFGGFKEGTKLDPLTVLAEAMFPVGEHTRCKRYKAEYTEQTESKIYFDSDVDAWDEYQCWGLDSGDPTCSGDRKYCEPGYFPFARENQNGYEDHYCRKAGSNRRILRVGHRYYSTDWNDKYVIELDCQNHFRKLERGDNVFQKNGKPNRDMPKIDTVDGVTREGDYLEGFTYADYVASEYINDTSYQVFECHTLVKHVTYYGEDSVDEDVFIETFQDPNSCEEKCYHDFDWNIYRVDCEQEWVDGPPTVQMPQSCTLDHFMRTGQCAFVYDNLSPLFDNREVKLAFDMKRCTNDNSDFSVDIDCVGAACSDMIGNMISVPCTTHSDCNSGKCQELELCDPIGELLWPKNTSDISVNMDPNEENNTCPVKDVCSNDVQAFRNRLVKAIMKVNNKDAASAGDHTGICWEPFFDDFNVPDSWVFEDKSNDIITITGLSAQEGFILPPTKPTPPPIRPQHPTSTPSELFVMECSGGLHFRAKKGKFLRGGMDLGILKRLIDGVVDISHEHIKCICKDINEDAIEKSFTPNVQTILYAINDAEPGQYNGDCQDLLQFDKMLGDLFREMGVNHTHLPNTCSIDQWNKKDHCSFKLKLPIPESLGDNSLFFVIKHCEDSIWPFVSVSGGGPLFEDFMKPCSDDSECGGYSCGHIGTDIGFAESAIVGSALETLGIYHDFEASTIFSEDEKEKKFPKEETSCTLCSVSKMIKKKILSWVREAIFDEKKELSQLKFCGMEEMIELTSSDRHRQTMSLLSSHVSQLQNLPIEELLDLPTQELFGRITEMIGNHLSPLHGRNLLQDYNDNTDEGHEIASESDDGSLLDDIELESWESTSSFTTSRKVSGEYFNNFHKEISTDNNMVNLLRVTCDSQMTVGGGTNKNGGAYFPKFGEIGNLASQIVKSIVDCRNPLKGLTEGQIKARFLMSDISFWLNVLTKHDGNLGQEAYDAAHVVLKEMMDAGKAQCEMISDGYWLYDDNGNSFESCNACKEYATEMYKNSVDRNVDTDFKCEPITAPMFNMPTTCSLKNWMDKGVCSFTYDNVQPWTDFQNMKIGFKMEKCPSNPGMVAFRMDCIGEDCEKMTDIANTPCASKADCPEYAECQIFELCDPFGDLIRTPQNDGEIRDPGNNTNDCPQNSDPCTRTTTFRNQLVKLMTKINQDDVSKVNEDAVGMCIPISVDAEDQEKRLEKWSEDAEVSMVQGDRNTMTIKGMSAYIYPVPAPTVSPRIIEVVTTIIKLNIPQELNEKQKQALAQAVKNSFIESLGDNFDGEIEVIINQIVVGRRRHLLQNQKWETTAEVTIKSQQEMKGSLLAQVQAITQSVETDGINSDFFKNLKEETSKQNDGGNIEITSVEVESSPEGSFETGPPTTRPPTDAPTMFSDTSSMFSGIHLIFGLPLLLFSL